MAGLQIYVAPAAGLPQGRRVRIALNRGLYRALCRLYSAALGDTAGAARLSGANGSMTDKVFDVVGIGNAIVDVLAHADDAFLAADGLAKGAMTLIDADRAERALPAPWGRRSRSSGGSAANTIAGVASLGGRGAYIGKVSDDQFGGVFRHDIRAIRRRLRDASRDDGPPTARCLIFVTPDAQRTMQTYLGACVELGPEDIDPERDRARQGHLSRRLSLGPAARQAGLPQGGGDRPQGRPQGGAQPLRPVLRRPPPRRVPRARRRAMSTSSSPTRTRSARSGRPSGFDEAAAGDARPCARSRRSTRSAKGSIVVVRRRTHVVDGRAGRARRRHHRRRRSLRRRLPLWLPTGGLPYDCARIGASPPPRSSAISVPARRRR